MTILSSIILAVAAPVVLLILLNVKDFVCEAPKVLVMIVLFVVGSIFTLGFACGYLMWKAWG